MKKLGLIFLSIIVFTNLLFAQAKKPTIMVVPSDAWCNIHGYMMEFDNQGTSLKIPDYKKAFQENTDLLLVTSKINGLMAERGFPLKNMESAIKTLQSNRAEDAMMASKETGMGASESPIDQLKKVAKADIIMQLTWTVNTTGPKKSVTFNLQGLDAYTDKQIATAEGTGAASFSAELPVLLEEAVLSHLDNFNVSLMNHFNDLFEKGREVIIRIKKWDTWEYDLESYFGPDDEELSFIIENWIFENSVEGRFSTTDATANMMLFEQVRMPMYYEYHDRQRAMDTRRFAKNLSKYLRTELNIESKVTTKGLGRATIYLGGK
ncbi:MAG: DUF6175 family protein [Bacteroidales bacterium]|jgi:hypothetical protein|nr:DUF6175 family protein [Bacteroidales bacterium]